MSDMSERADNALRGVDDDGGAIDLVEAELLAVRREALVEGWAAGVRLYAVWKDGDQLVGVSRRPLAEVLERNPYLEGPI